MLPHQQVGTGGPRVALSALLGGDVEPRPHLVQLAGQRQEHAEALAGRAAGVGLQLSSGRLKKVCSQSMFSRALGRGFKAAGKQICSQHRVQSGLYVMG